MPSQWLSDSTANCRLSASPSTFVYPVMRAAHALERGDAQPTALAAFVGAGGLDEPIITGLTLNDHQLILQGAIPSALLAMLAEFLFELLERRLVLKRLISKQVFLFRSGSASYIDGIHYRFVHSNQAVLHWPTLPTKIRNTFQEL